MSIDPDRIADSVTAANEPTGPGWFGAGYGDGHYDNWAQVVAEFGNRALLEVAVSPHDDIGNCLDIENGDATPADAPGWTVRARKRGVKLVWNYCDLAEWPQIIEAYIEQGLPLPDRWWIAHFTDVPHLPSVVVRGITYTADACQYSGGMTARFDTSCFRVGVFTTAVPAPIPVQEEEMAIAAHPTALGYWITKPDGSVEAFGAASYHGAMGPGSMRNAESQLVSPAVQMGAPCVGIAPTPSGNGYWLMDAKGEIYAFGDARPEGNEV